ncbi:MAG: hypothetical protein RXQ93_06385 [Caldisphaera sp.]|jgi:hypothetical protein|uniref:hypothetical protein n=1 Tax=Caldisphaera sp. TaxID=2060322 RepID=UPI00397BA11A
MAKEQKTKEHKYKVTIQWFKRDMIDLNDVSFQIYKLISKEENEGKGDPLNVLYKLAEEEKNKKNKGDFFIITIESIETKYVIADGIKDRNTRLLYNIPTRLNKVGLITKDKLKLGPEGYFILKNNDIKWIDINEELYVYDGPLKSNEDIELIIFDTDKDRRVIKTQHLSTMKLSFQTPEQQNQSALDNANASDADNNLS